MVNKGKGKADKGGPAAASIGLKDSGGKVKKGAKANTVTAQSGSGSGPGPGADQGPAAAAVAAKPTVKQLIGGSSWTGKLPVNLLSEHCQKQRWDKPEYETRKTADGFSVWVALSAKDGKTQQVVQLEPFRILPSHKHLLLRETAIEAKHAAATYALFRVCSMQNKHTVLPPDHKSLWKEFQALKAQDVKEGKGWMYEADPFKTLRERQDSQAAAEKKIRETEAVKAKAMEMPGASGLALLNGAGASSKTMKGWMTAPKVEMGRQTRARLEALLREGISWNPHGVRMSQGQRDAVVKDLSKIGFRRSHVAEAVEYCKDREETLEWLLIHVPEDDLPRWALPESYSAGISVGATNLRREGIIKSLSETGYSPELCGRILDSYGGDEDRAAEALQDMLSTDESGSGRVNDGDGDTFLEMGPPEEQWEGEVASLEAMYGEGFERENERAVRLRLESVKKAQDGRQGEVEAYLQIRRPASYPKKLVLAIKATLPSYIKLSIVKRAVAYLQDGLEGEPMKMYFVTDWVQRHINGIIDDPGKLVDISAVSSVASESRHRTAGKRTEGGGRAGRVMERVADAQSTEEWLKRQQKPEWKEMEGKRARLPAWRMRDCIARTVEDKDVTIIRGETGSGKSTQSVQFILDDLYERGLGKQANMMVTQPRRISALGLAERVAEERCSRVGQEVGYAIRGESRRCKETRITFVTTGVLLRRLQTSGGRLEDVAASLDDVSHVVIDEVHERSVNTDFLLNLMREVMRARRGIVKLVLMSATLDAGELGYYFASEGLTVGTVEMEGRTFPVEEYYLGDVLRMTGFLEDGGGTADDEATDKAMRRLGLGPGSGPGPGAGPGAGTGRRLINYRLLAETVRVVDWELWGEKKPGGILIFLPGVGEINQACRQLGELRGLRSGGLHVVPLHASLEMREQRRVFAGAPAGKRKVVVATNVAETSVTIDDIVVVIDSGRVKETRFDAHNNMRRLEETWASRAACQQRRGRAGRVQEGKCFKLFTRHTEQQQMAERPEPEMRRVPLEQLCLSVRAMGVRDVASFLGRSPTAPEVAVTEGALKLLRRMGALDGDELTAMGRQLAMLPTDLRCGKLMVLGALLGCLDACVTMAAVLSTRSPFMTPAERRDEAREARHCFSAGDGDLLTDLEAYEQWERVSTGEGAGQGEGARRRARAFCDDHFLSPPALADIRSTRAQFYAALADTGIRRDGGGGGRRGGGGATTTTTTTTAAAAARHDAQLLRALVAAAFTPQTARIQFPDKKYASSMSGAVELDPEARAIKYFTEDHGRVFLHPGSTLFGSQALSGNAAYVSYFSIMATSKVFIRDLTPFNAYALLLFCGSIELDTMGRGLVVDGWIRLRGWARIGVLVARLRGMLDALIAHAVEEPGRALPTEAGQGPGAPDGRDLLAMVRWLVDLNGMDA